MNRRSNWEDFKNILEQNHITKLYHFTDRDNLENIIKNGGLYSWKDCEERGINIPKPGGGGPGSPSWSLDKRDNLEHYVRVSFTMNHPMMYVAMNEDRISNPVILEIDPEVIYDENTKYADRNAVRNGGLLLLPGDIVVHEGRNGRTGYRTVAEAVSHVVTVHGSHILVLTDVLVTELTVAGTNLEHVNDVAADREELLLIETPT